MPTIAPTSEEDQAFTIVRFTAELSCPAAAPEALKLAIEAKVPEDVIPSFKSVDSLLREWKRKRKSKKKSKAVSKDGRVIVEEDECLRISADSKSCIAAAESGVDGVGSIVESLLQVVESLLQESLKGEEVSTEIVKEDEIPGGEQKRKKKSKARNKDGEAIHEEDKCIRISVDIKNCAAAAESGINGVGSVAESALQESLKVEEVPTEIAKEDKIPGGERKRKKKLKARNKDGNAILDEEVACVKVSADGKSCIATAELGIGGLDSTIEPLLSVSPVVEEVSTEIVQKQNTPIEKQRRKRKSKNRDKDEKVIVGEEDKCLKISVESNSGIAAAELGINVADSIVEPLVQESTKVQEVSTEISEQPETPDEKHRRKRKLKDTDNHGKVIPGEDDKRLKASADRKSCIVAAESIVTDVDLNVESLIQDSAMVEEASTEIVEDKKSPEGKRRRGRKSKSKNKVEILKQQDELLVTSIDEKCCTNTEMSILEGVDSRSKCSSAAVSSPISNGMVDLSNGLYQLPQRPVATCSRRILLILDINGLLADIVMPPPKERNADIHMLGRAIFKRPYCDDFLDFCFDTFDVGIWSSRSKKVIDKVVDYLLGRRKHKLLFCWDVSHTTVSKFKTLDNRFKPLVCKTLRNLWEKRDPSLPWKKGDYTEANTLLIDDSPYKALLNPMHTAIFPYSFTFKDLHDNTLGPGGEIREYLEELAKTDDVRKYVEQNPFGQSAITETSSSWDFYSQVVKSLSHSI